MHFWDRWYLSGERFMPPSYRETGPCRRLFGHLPPWQPAGSSAAEQGASIKRLAASLLETPEEDENAAGDHPDLPAGYALFTQFVANDVTLQTHMERSGSRRQPGCRKDYPRLDLHGLYGHGPFDSPYLYDPCRRDARGFSGFLCIGTGVNGAEEDLPRVQGRAIIGDQRNDAHVLLSQLHLAWIKFHNRILSELEALGMTGPSAFAEAQRLVRWHYQWVVIHDWLQRLVSPDLSAPLPSENDPACYRAWRCDAWPDRPFIPFEVLSVFSCLILSLSRSSYVLSDILEEIRDQVGVGGRIPFNVSPPSRSTPLANLQGGRPLPRFWSIQWDRFFEFHAQHPADASYQRGRRLNSKLAYPLGERHGIARQMHPLGLLELQHGWRLGLPSGQRIARALGLHPAYRPLGQEPLSLYLLQEAMLTDGKRLGPVGSILIAEGLMALLATDPSSFLHTAPTWQPQKEPLLRIAAEHRDCFQLTDILRFAQVPITRDALDAILL